MLRHKIFHFEHFFMNFDELILHGEFVVAYLIFWTLFSCKGAAGGVVTVAV